MEVGFEAEAVPLEGRGGTGLLPLVAGMEEGTMGGEGEGDFGLDPF